MDRWSETDYSYILCQMEPHCERKRVMPREDFNGKLFKNTSPNF